MGSDRELDARRRSTVMWVVGLATVGLLFDRHCGPSSYLCYWPRADAPFPRAKAKKRGPLQAVPVMVRAIAERLG